MTKREMYRESIIAGVLLIALIITCVIAVVLFTTPQKRPDYQPEAGTWYCEELSLYLSFDSWSGYFVNADGSTDLCTIFIEGDPYPIISICEAGEAYETEKGIKYISGKTILRLKYVHLSDSEYKVSCDDGKQYTFFKSCQTGDGSLS